MTSEQDLPAIGSVWGNPNNVHSWCKFLGVDDARGFHWQTWMGEFFERELSIESGSVDIRAMVASAELCEAGENAVWDEVVTSISRAWPGEQMSWHESPTELITRLIDERDEGKQKLDFLKSHGLTVGTMQESGKSPRLMYVIEPGSELCDLETVNKLVDAEIQRDKAIELLKRCYTAGHRQGWEDGESNAECFAEINNFLSNMLGGDWDMLDDTEQKGSAT